MNTLPANPEVERMVLGAIALDDSHYLDVAPKLSTDDFALESHRRIWDSMRALHSEGRKIDRITLTEALMRREQLDSVGGMTYIVALDDGLPHISNLESYVRIVREKATLRRLIYAGQSLIGKCQTGDANPDQIIAQAACDFMALGDSRDEHDLRLITDPILESGGMDAYMQRASEPGIPTGYSRLDAMTNGLKPGRLYIVAARPAMGKTGLALNIATNICTRQRDDAVSMFSLEMPKDQLLDRALCSLARVDSEVFRAGQCDPKERQLISKAAGLLKANGNLFVRDKPETSVVDIHSIVRRQIRKHPVKVVIIDYLQLMGSREDRRAKGDENRQQEVAAISRGLKLMAMDLGVSVIALSQLSRQCESRQDKRPMLSDLRESGAIEQDADLVAFLFREEVYSPYKPELRGLAELIVAKQRSGPVGTVPLVFLPEFVRFESKAYGEEECRTR